ncbi:protein 4.1-like isoform X4 [Lethenteron reissneri]|nr:protein 4.1-like isoform X4 [Lethenteron reissneri]
MACKVALLDGAQYECEVEKHSKGQVLFDKVCDHLNLLEKDYFGLAFQDAHDHKNWLDPAKDIKKQVGNGPWAFSFNVKFYPPDPSQLTEDITRYYVCLQLRQDVSSGRLPCSFVTLALLGSYALQAELGDHEADEHGADYVASSGFRFAPAHSHELLEKIAELHKTHRGQTPAEAERHFLENAKKLSMYGVDLHQAKDSEGVDITLGVCSSGLLVYKDRLRINRFPWPKILKISYKRSNFYIKIRPGELDQFESTIGFKLPNHRAAKRLWKVCVEHHTFFRLVTPEPAPKGRFLTLGSRFRYSGRTQAQTRAASSQIDRPAPHFTRSASKRYTVSSSLDGAPGGGSQDGSSWGLDDEPPPPTADPRNSVGGERHAVNSVAAVTTVTATTVTGGAALAATAGGNVADRAEKTDGGNDGGGDDVVGGGVGRDDDNKEETSVQSSEAQGEEVKRRPKKADGENIYIRHSRLMLEELERRPDELLLKRQASLSELKRSFLESRPDGAAGAMTAPPAGGWDIRLQEPSPVHRHGQPGTEDDEEEEDYWAQLPEEPAPSSAPSGQPHEVATAAPGDAAWAERPLGPHPRDPPAQFADELLVEISQRIEKKEEEGSRAEAAQPQRQPQHQPQPQQQQPQQQQQQQQPLQQQQPQQQPQQPQQQQRMSSSSSVSMSRVVYKTVVITGEPDLLKGSSDEKDDSSSSGGGGDGDTRTGPCVQTAPSSGGRRSGEEEEERAKTEKRAAAEEEVVGRVAAPPRAVPHHGAEATGAGEAQASGGAPGEEAEGAAGDVDFLEREMMKVAVALRKGAAGGHGDEGKPKANGADASESETSESEEERGFEPPLIATESVSFSEVSHTGRADFSTTDVPIVHTHTKTITYAATQEGRGGEASESSVLPEMAGFSAESVATTTTTHITKTVKGGISETRIEKRIVIMADTDIDHDQALAQAIREAKEQHPDMAVTKVVVHKETDVSIEDDDDDEEQQQRP